MESQVKSIDIAVERLSATLEIRVYIRVEFLSGAQTRGVFGCELRHYQRFLNPARRMTKEIIFSIYKDGIENGRHKNDNQTGRPSGSIQCGVHL